MVEKNLTKSNCLLSKKGGRIMVEYFSSVIVYCLEKKTETPIILFSLMVFLNVSIKLIRIFHLKKKKNVKNVIKKTISYFL
jgi:hypothetical protein